MGLSGEELILLLVIGSAAVVALLLIVTGNSEPPPPAPDRPSLALGASNTAEGGRGAFRGVRGAGAKP